MAGARKIISDKLERGLPDAYSHIEVRFARDGDELIKIIDELSGPPPPNLILFDINMPCKTGLECLKIIRSIKNYDTVPVLVVSTSNSIKDIEYSYANGASLYF